jgi:hypothetical protein
MVDIKCSRCAGDGMIEVLNFRPLFWGLCDTCRRENALVRLAEAIRLRDEEVAARPVRPPYKSTAGEWAVRRTMWQMNKKDEDVDDGVG